MKLSNKDTIEEVISDGKPFDKYFKVLFWIEGVGENYQANIYFNDSCKEKVEGFIKHAYKKVESRPDFNDKLKVEEYFAENFVKYIDKLKDKAGFYNLEPNNEKA